MILGNLLEALFKEGILLVTTSNLPSDELYRNGLQRNRFLPAITLLKKHTQIIPLQSQSDYRLRELKQAGVYFCPLNDHNTEKMQLLFDHLTHGSAQYNQVLNINDREIHTIACTQNVVWFEFNILCHTPRSQLDYLDIAQTFHTVFVSNIPKIASRDVNSARYLINLIDIFYDRRVKLILSSKVPLMEIYTEGELHFTFQRTSSRLLEMQSEEYLHLPHQPN
jgi:cell division protein ZapE